MKKPYERPKMFVICEDPGIFLVIVTLSESFRKRPPIKLVCSTKILDKF